MSFYIEVYNAAGTKLSDTAYTVSGVATDDAVNRIGQCEFMLPATVAVDIGAAYGKRYKLYHETLGLLGTYIHQNMTIDGDGQSATIQCDDTLRDLANTSLGFNRAYNNTPIQTAVDSLAGVASWTASFEAGVAGNIVVDYQGESVFAGLDRLRSLLRGWFRRETDTSIKFGRFGALITANLYGQFLYGAKKYGWDVLVDTAGLTVLSNAPLVVSATAQPLITRFKKLNEGVSVVTRMIPRGAGVGEVQLDLRYSTRTSPYTIQNRLNADGVTRTYYLEDAAAVASYGAIERVLAFSDIRPITNSQADLTSAANALYDVAVAYLQRYKAPSDSYEIEAVNVPATLKPGDAAVIDFRGVSQTAAGATAWLTVDRVLVYVLEVRRRFDDATGECVTTLTVSESGERAAGMTDVFVDVMHDVARFKTNVVPSMAYYYKAGPTLPISNTRTVRFKFFIGPEVLELNALRVEFNLAPLRSYAGVAGAGGGSTSGGGGATTVGTATGGSPASHQHPINVGSGTSGEYVRFDGYSLHTQHQQSPGVITTDYGGGFHTHGVSVNIPSHSHSTPDHTHPLTFGVFEDSRTSQGVGVTLDGVALTDIRNDETQQIIGATISGAGLFSVDLLQAGSPLLSRDFRNQVHEIVFSCTSEQGQLFAAVAGRVTIQPIRV